jgi:hypothetical protein
MRPVLGTSQSLEKPYFRLTAAADPATVRPEHVLRQALRLAVMKLTQGGEYAAACEQFKSIRQDLTVQHIRNEFAVEVYETHARAALTNSDFGEFNQCQTQLFALYQLLPDAACNRCEFVAYRILYHVMMRKFEIVRQAVAELDQDVLASDDVALAMELRRTAIAGNYHAFFAAARQWNLPTAQSLLGEIIRRMRDTALRVLVAAYRPTLPVAFVQAELGFAATRIGNAECLKWLREYGAVLLPGNRDIDTRVSVPAVSATPPPVVTTKVF